MPHIITQLWGQCPVQAFGFVNGCSFYFRAIDNQWAFSVAPTPDANPVEVQAGIVPGFSIIRPFGRRRGTDASWMKHWKARQCIHFAVQRYLREQQMLRKESNDAPITKRP